MRMKGSDRAKVGLYSSVSSLGVACAAEGMAADSIVM